MKYRSRIKRLIAFCFATLLCFGAASCKNTGNQLPTASPQSEYPSETVVASIGDRTVTYALYKAAFESYADYAKQMGFDPYSSKDDLKGFQDLVINALVADMVTLYHAEQDGFTLSDDAVEAVKKQADTELKDIHDEYWALAKTANENDPSKSIEEHFDELIGEMAEFYTGHVMTFDEYSEDYTKELMNSRLIEDYKDHVCSEFTVTDAQISEWYTKQYESDEALYSENPGQFKADAEYFAMHGGSYADAYPPTYVPEGYSRIMDIVVYPSGTLGDEYKTKTKRLDEITDECSTLLFNDALNGDNANSARIAELIAEYRTLKAEVDGMYDSYIESARTKLEAAQTELDNGTPFAEVMRKYTENASVIGDDSNPACEEFLTKGQYISTGLSCPNDWSATVKEIYSIIPEGTYSEIFTDTDGSLHVIYHGEKVKPGAVELDSIFESIRFIVRSENSDSDWSELLDAWMDDKDVHIDMDIVHSIGRDKLAAGGMSGN